jgi:hypothetical protein
MEKGPFNLVFHGVEPDWIEAEMDDDPDFQRDVLEQKIKAIVRDEVSIEMSKQNPMRQILIKSGMKFLLLTFTGTYFSHNRLYSFNLSKIRENIGPKP